ncbi:hypothetical protein VTJ49DRAFT_1405 [Mycothermus thermophilus]|uniref:Uncharacterized protein n=1 Tax=Humicola insolens TaxID=85995 RepID=A0ABR3VCW6_HUMIN
MVTAATTRPTRYSPLHEKCTISLVRSRHDSPSISRSRSSSPSSALSSSSLASGLWIGIALALTTSGCSSSAKGCDGTALDWVMMGSVAFQLYFFVTVVWQELRSLCRQPSDAVKRWIVTWEWFWLWFGHWLKAWWERLSAMKPWWHGSTDAPSFLRRLD